LNKQDNGAVDELSNIWSAVCTLRYSLSCLESGRSAWPAGGNYLLVLFVKSLSFSKIRDSTNTNHYMECSKFSEQCFQPSHLTRLIFLTCFIALAIIKNRLQDFCSSCPKTYYETYFIAVK